MLGNVIAERYFSSIVYQLQEASLTRSILRLRDVIPTYQGPSGVTELLALDALFEDYVTR